ncbi:MAG: hypothetical protein RLZZ458_2602 [Planctomycetota bacterium]|jgi:hypothetical protein
MAAGAVYGADDWKDHLSAVCVTGEDELVAEFAGISEAIGGMAEEDAEVCRRVAGVLRRTAHPGPFAAGDKQVEASDLCRNLSSGR